MLGRSCANGTLSLKGLAVSVLESFCALAVVIHDRAAEQYANNQHSHAVGLLLRASVDSLFIASR